MLLDIIAAGNDLRCDDLRPSLPKTPLALLIIADATTPFSVKLTLSLMFLIVIRGCVPRYRYDLLTKMG